MTRSLDDTNVDGTQLPPIIRSVLSLQATGKLISKDPISDVWRPPKFDEAEKYVFAACKAWTERFWMGTRFGENLFGVARGYVSCKETLENPSGQLDLHGFGTMEWDGGTTDVVVLGLVGGSGTALLLDRMGNVWLYNHPEAIDKPHVSFREFQAAIFLPAGHTAEKNKEMVLSNVLTRASVTMIPDEIEEYEL